MSQKKEAPVGTAVCYGLALGLFRHPGHHRHPRGNPGLVARFAKNLPRTDKVWDYTTALKNLRLVAADVGPNLETQLLELMERADQIYFQLDGIMARGHGRRLQPRQVASLRAALLQGELGTAIPTNVTKWEFFVVWTRFRGKTTFYWKKNSVDLNAVLR